MGEMETLGNISLLMGMMSGFHHWCFVPGSWLNLVLVPEEGPSAVTESLRVRRGVGATSPWQGHPRWGRASPKGEGVAHFSLCNRIKTPPQSLAWVLSLHLSEREKVFNLV